MFWTPVPAPDRDPGFAGVTDSQYAIIFGKRYKEPWSKVGGYFMDLAVLQKIAAELDEPLRGGFINKIHQPLPREVVLRVRTRGAGEKKLMISADPLLGRIQLTDLKIPNPPTPPRFCAFLRAHVQGARITGVSAAAADRVVFISTTRGPTDSAEERDIVLELLGRDSNIVLVDRSSNKIMDCLHRIPEKETATRVVLPGMTYQPPPSRGKPATAWLSDIALEQMRPGIAQDAKGRRRLTLTASPEADQIFESMNAAAEAYYRPKLESLLLGALRRETASPIRTRIRALERREKKIKEDIQKLESLAERLHEGELLKVNLGLARKGSESVTVSDWATGEPRVIKLNPALAPVENMELIFKKAAKGKRGKNIAEERLAATRDQKAALEDLLYYVESAEAIDELERLAAELPAAKSRGRKKKSLPGKKSEEPRGSEMFREFRSPSGLTVLVGKSGRGNDFLLRHKARKGDLWFHVKGRAGAHVLLPCRGGVEPSDEDKTFAAGLAVRFSHARGKGKTEVIVADVSDVSRPKGALPGQVIVRHYTTMIAKTPD
jgi:predicted ribosome quality control (RQC) complex YloA/Tae2 family protein